MSLETLQNRDFSERLSKYTEYFKNNDVDLDKIRFIDKPNFIYDYELDIVSSNPILFFNGRLIKTEKTIMINCDSYDITDSNISEVINNTNLGIVVYVDNLVKKYIDGDWRLQIQMVFLDEKMDILNDFDDVWVVSDDETLESKVESIKMYFSENIAPLDFMTISPTMLEFIKTQGGYDNENRIFAGLPIKVNGNMKDDIISLSTYEESFYLKVTNA